VNPSPNHRLPNRRRFLELVLTALVIVAAICLLARYTVTVPETASVSRTLDDLRLIDAAADQYSLENTHPGSTPAPATPSPTTPSTDPK
jgi:hypothetical protein